MAGTLCAALPCVPWAQKKISRVGMLGTGTWNRSPGQIFDMFTRRMQELGWTESRNVEYVLLSADGYVDRLDGLARSLVEQKVDVIVAGPPPSAIAARNATRTIPIVMGNVPDPVALGLVASLARPGGNVTGVSSQTDVLVGKQIELLREIVPGATRIGILYSEKNPSATAFREVAGKAALSLRLSLVLAAANGPENLAAAVQRLLKEGAQAVAVPADPMMLQERRALNDLLAKARLPAVFGNRDHALDGGLMSYAPDILENFRLAAGYVDKILKGADPAQLPVEQSSRIGLLVNVTTAKILGLTIPPAVLLRAEEVIR